MARLFISYSHVDDDFARRLATSLSAMGADVWIDIEDIPAGMKWSSAIQQGLDSGQLLIVIISPDSMASRNVEDEWQYYLDSGKPIVPVLLHPARIHFQLNRIQYIDFRQQDYATAIHQLHAQLKSKGIELDPPAETSPAAATMPDFDKMSTQEIEVWMGALRQRQEQRRTDTPTAPPVRPPSRRAGWQLWAGGVAVVAVIALLAIIVLSGGLSPATVQPTPAPTLNPDADSDGDGLTDAEEVIKGTDPNTPDSDNDGLTDKDELDLGTDPNNADSDEDGLFDGDEVKVWNTDPISSDSDGDTLSDGDEVGSCTGPLSMDSDEDGVRDDVEHEQGTECDDNTIEPTPVAITPGLPGNPISYNSDWTAVTRTINSVEMVLVPVGSFTMGTSADDLDSLYENCQQYLTTCRDDRLFDDEAPPVDVAFDYPFWIDRYEVTNGQYGAPDDHPGDTVPRTNVTWNQAQAFCEAQGGRLPTEAEWEYAARGPDSLHYPWGDTFVGANFNYCDASCEYDWRDTVHDDDFTLPAPVGSFPDSVSWVGAEDMAGNVWEWTSTVYTAAPGDSYEDPKDADSPRTLKGSSWNWLYQEARGAARAAHATKNPQSPWYGFRCARDFVEGDFS